MSENQYSDFLERENSLLLLVDIQETMLKACVEWESLVKNSAALIEIARILRIPVLFTEHNADKLGGFHPELSGKVSNPNILNKVEFSCFENDGIYRAIERTQRRTILLAGIEAHVCIFHTGAHALSLGYRVHVAADAVSSRSVQNRDIGVRRLEKAGAVVSSTEMMIFELLQRAGTEEFRAALPLIKSL